MSRNSTLRNEVRRSLEQLCIRGDNEMIKVYAAALQALALDDAVRAAEQEMERDQMHADRLSARTPLAPGL